MEGIEDYSSTVAEWPGGMETETDKIQDGYRYILNLKTFN